MSFWDLLKSVLIEDEDTGLYEHRNGYRHTGQWCHPSTGRGCRPIPWPQRPPSTSTVGG